MILHILILKYSKYIKEAVMAELTCAAKDCSYNKDEPLLNSFNKPSTVSSLMKSLTNPLQILSFLGVSTKLYLFIFSFYLFYVRHS